ncbi:MAG: hypothetical protein H0T11_02665 [Chthoniobacterales bacterium]|nr:hypothetical protein [Chthoniobacterales bacterium]
MKRLFPIVSSLLFATTLLAQDATSTDDTAINTGAGIMAGACGWHHSADCARDPNCDCRLGV